MIKTMIKRTMIKRTMIKTQKSHPATQAFRPTDEQRNQVH
jgi:hypothetical protein